MHLPPEFLLFDLDGTLSDPQLGITRSINHALRAMGHAEREPAALCQYIGPPLDESFRILTARDDPDHILALVGHYRDRYGERGYAENTLYPGVPEALAALAATGIGMAVCTSKHPAFAERILALFGLRRYFSAVHGGEIGLQKWQQMARLRAERLVPPRTLMIGDRAVDLIAAHRNGLASGAVTWGHGSREELLAERPLHVFEQPADWLCLLDGRTGQAVAD
jgi:phosphoglycolate phosphatase